jgi:hypothetical protein
VAHQVVAVQRDVEDAGRNVRLRCVRTWAGGAALHDVADGVGEAPRNRDAARADTDEREVVDAAIAFEDFVRDAREGTGNSVGVENDWHASPLRSLAGPR